MSIITLEDYKEYAGIPTANTKLDNKLQTIVDYVNDYIPKYCNIDLLRKNVTEKVTCDNGLDFLVSRMPLISVSEILVNGVAFTDYRVDTKSGLVETTGSNFPTTRFAIEITYDYGYGSGNAPDSLKATAIEFITHLHKREWAKSRDLGNGESMQYDSERVLPQHIRLALDMHKVL